MWNYPISVTQLSNKNSIENMWSIIKNKQKGMTHIWEYENYFLY